MTKTSPAKPIPKPRQELIELPEDSGAIFQAVGILPGEVAFDVSEEGQKPARPSITVAGKQYTLYYSTEHPKALRSLSLEVEATGPTQRLIVYPQVRHFPGKDNPYQLNFQVLGFIGRKHEEGCISEVLQDFEFRIAGLWQFIPVCQTPCLTVLRNFTDERLGFVKEATVSEKVKFMKASHVPLLWKDAAVRPFRFNPKLDSLQQGKAPFVQITAKFLPERDVFEFAAMRSLPATNSPKFLKAGKKDKADALAQSKTQQGKGKGITESPKRSPRQVKGITESPKRSPRQVKGITESPKRSPRQVKGITESPSRSPRQVKGDK